MRIPGVFTHVVVDTHGFPGGSGRKPLSRRRFLGASASALAAGRATFPRLHPLAAPGNTPSALACSTTGPGPIPPPGSITG